MSYTIQPNRPFFAEVEKIVDSQAEKGLDSLRQQDDLEEAIHDVRRRCKKVRAAWRLLRDELGDQEYKRRNRYYRDTARLLSDARDATAVLESLDNLERQFGDAVYVDTFREMREALKVERDGILPDPAQQPAMLARAQRRLEKAKAKVNPIDQSFEDWSGTVDSLTRTYGRGFVAFEHMKKEPTAETMHEWRKRTKYLRYELRMLKTVWKPLINPWRKQLHQLTDWQGHHHDLHVLKQAMQQQPQVSDQTQRTLLALATQYQAYTYRMAMPLGQRLFAEKPKHFAKRMRQYLLAWNAEPEAPQPIRIAFS